MWASEEPLNPVEAQYAKWMYPAPIYDLEEWARTSGDAMDPLFFHRIMWPDRPYRPLDILIAGCGSFQAARIAHRNPTARVVGIDLSEPSLAHNRMLQEKHGLTNLELRHQDIAKAGGIGEFDLIISTGVLHHMPDPDEGLAVLASLLRPDGVLGMMVYGQHARAGVYMLQDVFRRVGLEQVEDDISLVRGTIDHLHEQHPGRTFYAAHYDMRTDAGVVDAFMNVQDRAYTVPQLLGFVENAGLQFQVWLDNAEYNFDRHFRPDHPLRSKVMALPERERWAVVEALSQKIGRHSLFVRLNGAEIVRPADDVLAAIPSLRPGAMAEGVKDDRGRSAITIKRGELVTALSAEESSLVAHMDGKRSVREIARAVQAPNEAAVMSFSERLFRGLYEFGHVVLSTA
jgi:SAM-dependent methyltransferase